MNLFFWMLVQWTSKMCPFHISQNFFFFFFFGGGGTDTVQLLILFESISVRLPSNCPSIPTSESMIHRAHEEWGREGWLKFPNSSKRFTDTHSEEEHLIAQIYNLEVTHICQEMFLHQLLNEQLLETFTISVSSNTCTLTFKIHLN